MAPTQPKRASADQLPRLLLVDDSEAVLALEKAALGSTYRLEAAMNGRLALASMQRSVPDAVLLDLSMPEMDGDQVLLAMRADLRLRDVPVLVISTESQRARDTLRLGADDFLAKPATAEVLRRRVGALLEAAAQRRAQRLRPFLFFRCGSQALGLPLDQVYVITARPALRPLPAAPPHMPGFFELYGKPVPVLDLAARLGLEQEQDLLERKVVVLALKQGLHLGLEASEVWDPEGLAQDDVLEEDRFTAPFAGLKGHLQCLARCSRGLVPILRSEPLFDEAELGALAKELGRVRA
jgi:CheY-like chemotaxis protein/chemotaxis signal transduction protein